MATLLLSAAGAAIGGSLGGSVAGIAAGVLGKAAGATLGAVIDQRLLGAGSEPVDAGRVDRFRVMGASEGAALPRVFGRARVAGQIVWSSRFLEDVDKRRVGGKGGGPSQKVREHSYSISLAVALCEGEVTRVGRIWADGQQLDLSGIVWRLHPGDEAQAPDPLIAAIEGPDLAPAYRGTAYVVFENLELGPFGNRIPQFNLEVVRRAEAVPGLPRPPALDVRGVALVPGTGEYALATEPVRFRHGKGRSVVANVNNDRGRPDFVVSLEQMRADLPAAVSVSLVVSWFGDDLRCDRCELRPAVEQAQKDGQQMAWRVSGVGRADAKEVSRTDGRPAFGGTSADAAVVQAIRHIAFGGQSVMFYPFILMDIFAGNGRADPWSEGAEQPPVPWRGRITLSRAPGRPGSPDKTAAATDEVAAFFGAAQVSDFRIEDGAVAYSGPEEWSYRRFILHYAHLCALAGGVDAFCIGSEMRSLTQVRDGAAAYPAVRALRMLAGDVRAVLGPGVKLGYAADWSEYFGHQPADGSGDAIFHLDPLWAHPDIDFVGIDNYMPLSDWRDGASHADAAFGSIYDLGYLTRNVAGGEGYHWHYPDAGARERQHREPISDGSYGEPWVFRYKDIASWWGRPHHDRIGGVRAEAPTAWTPRSKPVWFTELGCPAVDKGTNQPNVFHDPKSVESFFPYFSDASRDEFVQQRYLQATFAYWNEPENNPASDRYDGRMVDMARAHVWAWDARPWPDFPDRRETWVDGENFERGHWINTRIGLPSLAEVAASVCRRADVTAVDVTDLHGCVTGYVIGGMESARQTLQPLMLAHAFDSFARADRIAFAGRSGRVAAEIDAETLATDGTEPTLRLTRSPASEASGRVVFTYVRSEADYGAGSAEAVAPEATEPDAAQSGTPEALTDAEARAVSERWLAEARVARDAAVFDLPPSALGLMAGDVVALAGAARPGLFRIDRIEEHGRRRVAAVRVEPGLYRRPTYAPSRGRSRPLPALGPVHVEFLDLPLLVGDEAPHAPHVAVTKTPWTGPAAVYVATNDFGYVLNRELLRPATMGETLDPLPAAVPGLWCRRSVRVRLDSGALQSAESGAVLDGANAAAVRHGSTAAWEVLQFATARLIGPDEYLVGDLLRGQAGTDGVAPEAWPAGADFVLLDGAVGQIDLPASARGLLRHFRVGPSGLPYDHPSYEHLTASFPGNGLRPYRPAHLTARVSGGGDVVIGWIRRTRTDGDGWQGLDVPLGEDREAYHVRVVVEGGVVRDVEATRPEWTYVSTMRSADGATGAFDVEVAQVSDRFGPGPYARLAVRA
jgi:hypothetical protein